MKICIFGNQDNSGYRIAIWLRESGHHVALYLMRNWESARSRPEAIDRDLERAGYPDWIRQYDNTPLNTLFRLAPEIDEIEADFEIVVVIGSMAMMQARHFRKIPFVNLSTGPSNQGVIRMWDHISLKHRAFWTTVRFFVRRSVRKCDRIFVHYDPEIYSLAKLGQLGKSVIYGMPEDISGNADRVDQSLLNELNEKYCQFDRVFLWLGRIAYSDPKNPMYKGADKFIEAADAIIRDGANVRLVIGKHGEDYERLRQLIEAKGLSSRVEWVDHMPYWRLLTYLSIANAVVVDELTSLHCVSSGMFRETLSVGGVLIRSISQVMTRAGHGGGDCPVLHAETVEEAAAKMWETLRWSEADNAAWRARVRVWSSRYLAKQNQIDRLVEQLAQIVYVRCTAQKLATWY